MDVSEKIKMPAFFLFAAAALFFASEISADSTYTVKKGDTLYSISRKYELTVAELRAANNLSESDVLQAGARLVIPTADIGTAAALSGVEHAKPAPSGSPSVKTDSYTVQKGDTLYGIARKFDIKLAELLSLNNIDTGSTLKAGQRILVPSATAGAKEASADSGRTGAPSPDSSGTKYSGVVWPLESPSVKSISGKVSGVQLTGRNNESVRAVHSGTVMYTGVYRGFGEIVFVQSKTGLIYAYSGLDTVKAKKGDYVVSGDEIGRTGKGGEAAIKFMVFQNGTPIDPAKAPRG